MRDLVPRPGIEPGPPALGVQSLTHWTIKEVPSKFIFITYSLGEKLFSGNSTFS